MFTQTVLAQERVTIRQLARLSGVSVGTVSRALNGYSDVRPETRERIMRLASELDYTPTAAARALVTQRSHVIGVVLDTGEGHPDLQHPFFHEVIVGLKNHIGANGFDLLLFASERPGNGYGPHSYLKRCRHHNVDGVVLMGVDGEDPEVLRVVDSELPTAGVDVELAGPATTFAISDNVAGAREAVRHLHALGHRRIATITGLLRTRPGKDRLQGYGEGLAELGLPARADYVLEGDFYGESGRAGMAQLLALDVPPTAVFAASDMMALGAIHAVTDAGLSVPGDVSVVGFDDMQLADQMNPSLTTLRQDKAALGAAAGAELVRMIEGEDDGAAPFVMLPVELIARASSAPPTV
jgi:LacI family transcriptional regulator